MVASLLLAGAFLIGSFQLDHFSARFLQQLDETVVIWILPTFALGLFACFKLGKR
jgi:hypothetical protein